MDEKGDFLSFKNNIVEDLNSDIKKLEDHLDDIRNYYKRYSDETGTNKFKKFVEFVQHFIFDKLKDIDLDERDDNKLIEIIFNFLKIFIPKNGETCFDKEIVKTADMFLVQNCKIHKNMLLRRNIINVLIKRDLLGYLQSGIDTCDIETLSNIISLSTILKESDKTDTSEIIECIVSRIDYMLDKDIRNTALLKVPYFRMFDLYYSEDYDDYYDTWFKFAHKQCSTQIFSIMESGYYIMHNILHNVLGTDMYHRYDWFSYEDNYKILTKQVHVNIMKQYISSICKMLAENECLKFSIIVDIWRYCSYLHESELEVFFDVFFDIIGIFITKPKIYDSKDQFISLRGEIEEMILSSDNNTVKALLYKYLPIMYIKYPPYPLSTYFIEKFHVPECFLLLTSCIKMREIELSDDIDELLNISLNQLEFCGSHSYVFDFIVDIATFDNCTIKHDDLNKAIKYSTSECVSEFAKKAIDNKIVDIDVVYNVVSENFSFFSHSTSFIKFLVERLDDERSEKLLWSLLKSSEAHVVSDACELITNFYIREDLSEEGANIFLKKWLDLFQENPFNINLIDVCLKFFPKSEEKTLRTVFSYREEISDKLTMKVSDQSNNVKSLIVPSKCRVIDFYYHVSKEFSLPLLSFECEGITKLRLYDHLCDYFKDPASDEINLIIVNSAEIHLPVRKSCFYEKIMDANIINQLYVLLMKHNKINIFRLLKCFPVVSNVKKNVDLIKETNHIDFPKFLNVEKPYIFKYNFWYLVSCVDIATFDEIGGIDYLIETYSRSHQVIMNSIIKYFIKNKAFVMDKYRSRVFHLLFNSIPSMSDNCKSLNTLTDFLVLFRNIELSHSSIESFYTLISVNTVWHKRILRCYIDNPDLIPILEEILLNKQCNNDMINNILKLVQNFEHIYSKVIYDACIQIINTDNSNYVKDHVDTALTCIHKMFTEFPNDLICLLNKKFLVIENSCILDSLDFASKILSEASSSLTKDHILSLRRNIPVFRKYKNCPSCLRNSSLGPGLINPSQLCYLISILQQFYEMPKFRSSIVSYKGDNNFLIELRNLFLNMFYIPSNSFDLDSLVKNWRVENGEMMRIYEQQDACEYICDLINKIEKFLSKDLIKELFCGSTINYTKGIDVDFSDSQTEDFYIYNVTMNGSNLMEAIEKSKTPFRVNSYKTEKLGSIDVFKSTELNSLPPYLVIPLSRFKYNHADDQNEKINSRFEFPETFSFKDEEYKLSGVVCHHGFANMGHYTSFVRVRKSNKWKKCDDETVTSVEIDQVLDICYDRGYILFYDRSSFDINENHDIDQEVSQKIQNIVYSIYQNRLFCSEGFFKIIQSFNDDLTLDYIFDTFMYCLICSDTQRNEILFENITKAIDSDDSLKDRLCFILSDRDKLSKSLIFTDHSYFKSCVANLIVHFSKCISTSKYKDIIVSNMDSLVNDICTYKDSQPNYFKILYYLQKENCISKENDQLWQNNIDVIISKNENIDSVDFEYMLLFIAAINTSTLFSNFIEKYKNFALNLLCSSTEISVVKVFFDNVNVTKQDVINLVEEDLLRTNTKINRLNEFLKLYDSNIIDIIVNENVVKTNDHKILNCFKSFLSDDPKLVLDNIDKWFYFIFSSDYIECLNIFENLYTIREPDGKAPNTDNCSRIAQYVKDNIDKIIDLVETRLPDICKLNAFIKVLRHVFIDFYDKTISEIHTCFYELIRRSVDTSNSDALFCENIKFDYNKGIFPTLLIVSYIKNRRTGVSISELESKFSDIDINSITIEDVCNDKEIDKMGDLLIYRGSKLKNELKEKYVKMTKEEIIDQIKTMLK